MDDRVEVKPETSPQPDGRGDGETGGREETKDAEPKKVGDAEDDEERSALKEWVGLLVRAGIWALLIYVFIFQISVVEGQSMEPSFHPGDRLFIDKLTYRFSDVRRFDVIVFEATDVDKIPRRPKDYIKRIIGLPGETIEVHDGAVWRDGKKLTGDEFGPTYPNEMHDPHQVLRLKVPPRQYFVMGDNRDASKDSRVDDTRIMGRQSLGFVPQEQIRGIVRLRFWQGGHLCWNWFGRKTVGSGSKQ
ncbi:MAG TPA: signal peptidase I [Planctomycetota bacterium]|jgi:signal peptidase I